MEIKKFTRSEEHRLVAGVCGGIAEYYETDPMLVRLLFVFTLPFGAVPIFAYLFLWLVVPEKGAKEPIIKEAMNPEREHRHHYNHTHGVLGFFLIMIGVLFLLDNMFPWLGLRTFWPLILILIGLAIMLRKHEHDQRYPHEHEHHDK